MCTDTNKTHNARGGQTGTGLGSASGMLQLTASAPAAQEIQSAFCWEHTCPTRALSKCYCQGSRRADWESRAGRGSRMSDPRAKQRVRAKRRGGVGVPAWAPQANISCPGSLGSDPQPAAVCGETPPDPSRTAASQRRTNIHLDAEMSLWRVFWLLAAFYSGSMVIKFSGRLQWRATATRQSQVKAAERLCEPGFKF